jgi:hypothetical protein
MKSGSKRAGLSTHVHTESLPKHGDKFSMLGSTADNNSSKSRVGGLLAGELCRILIQFAN